MVAHVHRRVDREQEEAHPQLVQPGEQPGIGAQQQREGLAVAEFVVAPRFEPLEDRVEAQLGVRGELAVDRDIACIADLLGQVDRVEDELRLEVMVLLGLGQETEVDPDPGILERLVDEAGMAALVAGEQLEELLHVGVRGAAGHLGIEDAARELRGQRAHQKVDELGAQGGFELLDHPGKAGRIAGIALEVALVGVAHHLGDHGVPLLAHGRDVDGVERGEVGGVEPRAEHGLVRDHGMDIGLVGSGRGGDGGMGVHRRLPGLKLTS